VFVKLGTVYANSGWVATVDDITTFEIGVDPIEWVQFAGAGTFTAGTGLSLVGTEFSVNSSLTHVTEIGTLTAGTWNASTIAVNRGGTGQTSYTNGQLLIGNSTGNTLAKATLTGGSNVTITNGAGSISIAAADTNLGQGGSGNSRTITSSTGTDVTVSTATTSNAGFMSTGDKTKLDGIADGAQVNVATNLSWTAGTTAGPQVNSSTGSNAVMPTATASASGAVTTGAQTWAGNKTFNNDVRVRSFGVNTAASGTAGEIRATNNVTAFFSDDRLKTRVGNIEDALQKINTLDAFYYIPNKTAIDLGYEEERYIGLSAQQVNEIFPEVVKPAPIDDKYLTIQYDKLIPLLVAGIKELRKQVDTMQKEIKEVKNDRT
jgi:hypothetical protein